MKLTVYSFTSLLLCVILILSGCSHDNSIENYESVSEDELYQTYNEKIHIEYNNGDSLFVNRDTVLNDGTISSDTQKIMAVIQQHLRATASCFQGKLRIADSDLIAEDGLEHELDCRYRYLARDSVENEHPDCDMFVDYLFIDVREDAAKAIVSYKLQQLDAKTPVYEQTEGYVFKHIPGDSEPWQLVNVLFDPNDSNNDIFRNLEENQDTTEWLTSYSFTQLQRSDYTDQPNYSYFVNDKMEIDESRFNRAEKANN